MLLGHRDAAIKPAGVLTLRMGMPCDPLAVRARALLPTAEF
jgi:hypothetical protein